MSVTIPNWRDHKPLVEAQQRLANAEALVADMVARVETTKVEADAAARALLTAEGLHRARRVNDAQLKRARDAAGDALATAQISQDALDNHRRSIEAMRAAFPTIQREAIDISVAALQAAYAPIVRRFVEALGQVVEARTELAAVLNAAGEQFPNVNQVRDPDFGRWPGWAGLKFVEWPRHAELTREDYVRWRGEIERGGALS